MSDERRKKIMKDMFKKTFDQLYEEMEPKEKVGYWIFVALVFSLMVFMFFL